MNYGNQPNRESKPLKAIQGILAVCFTLAISLSVCVASTDKGAVPAAETNLVLTATAKNTSSTSQTINAQNLPTENSKKLTLNEWFGDISASGSILALIVALIAVAAVARRDISNTTPRS